MYLDRLIRKSTRALRGQRFFYRNTFATHTRHYQCTQNVVILFYAISLFFGLSEMSWGWDRLLRSQFIEVLWPFEIFKPWIRSVFIPLGFYGWIFGAFASLQFPRLWFSRAMHGVGVFIIVGLRNSDGHFGHNYHAFMWVSLIFMFLPASTATSRINRSLKHRYIQIFWSAQFVICVFYLMTGLWKVRSLVACALSTHLQCELSEKVLTNIAAQELIRYRQPAPVSWVLFSYPWIGFFSYVATIWIHLYSLHFCFRPKLHGLFGFLRVIFHLGTLALFGVNFSPFTLTVICIFLFSPFSLEHTKLSEMLKQTPPLDLLIKVGVRLKSSMGRRPNNHLLIRLR